MMAARRRHIHIPPPRQRVAKQHPQIAKPEVKAAQIQNICSQIMRFRCCQFRIAVRVLGVAVVVLMETEEPARPDQQQHPRTGADKPV